MHKNFWKDLASGWVFRKEELPWPVDETGQKEKAVLLQSALDMLSDADMIISMLAAYGIPCFKHYAKEGAAGKVINGFSGYGAGLRFSRENALRRLPEFPAGEKGKGACGAV